MCFPYSTILIFFLNDISGICYYFPTCDFSSIFHFAWLCIATKILRKWTEKLQFFLRKIYKKEKSEICYDEREECTLKHLTKSEMERFWEYTIRSGGGFFMIRESNTLTWQETAERKKDDAEEEKEHGDEKERYGGSAGCYCCSAVFCFWAVCGASGRIRSSGMRKQTAFQWISTRRSCCCFTRETMRRRRSSKNIR